MRSCAHAEVAHARVIQEIKNVVFMQCPRQQGPSAGFSMRQKVPKNKKCPSIHADWTGICVTLFAKKRTASAVLFFCSAAVEAAGITGSSTYRTQQGAPTCGSGSLPASSGRCRHRAWSQ